MNIDSTDRSPMFDFMVPTGADPFPNFEDRYFERGYRYEGTPYSPLAARQKDKKKLCDAFNIINVICVSLKFKDIVEGFEPGLHQFFPIVLQAKDGASYFEPYFIFNPCTIIDAYLGLADKEWHEVFGSRRPYAGPLPKGTVSSLEIAGHHIWVGGFTGYRAVHISDALYKRLNKEKVRYLRFQPLAESDAIWRPEDQMPRALRWIEADPARIRDMIETRPDWVRLYRPDWLQ